MAEFGWFNAPLIVAIVLSIWATIAVMIARDYARNARRGAQHRFLDVSGPGVLSATDGKRDIAKAEYVQTEAPRQYRGVHWRTTRPVWAGDRWTKPLAMDSPARTTATRTIKSSRSIFA